MQSQDNNNRSAGAVNHPGAEEWMAYLYHETTPERARELRHHVEGCATCGEQLNRWRRDLATLDEWKLPALGRTTSRTQPVTVLKWAAAAAVVLCVGFAVGRTSSTNAHEIAGLKASVAELTKQVNRQQSAESNSASLPNNPATRDEVVQLLADYSKLNEQQRMEDRRFVGLALQEMNLRLGKLRTELETVALNTENGFQQTKEGLTTLASYAVADRGGATDLKETNH